MGVKHLRVVCFPVFLGLALYLGGCDKLPFGSSEGAAKRSALEDQTNEPHAKGAVADTLSYVGRERCAKCHEDAVQGYVWSAHDRSTELARGEAVEAPFDGETLSDRNIQVKFSKKGNTPVIAWTKESPVEWTIGYAPLQQYILAKDKGRHQVFFGAFDTRNKGDGGKRWYVLDSPDAPPERDRHFERRASVWNADCARCHSTAVQKNYDVDKDTYETKFQDLDVSCEACHGPASQHVELAERYASLEKWPSTIENAGFVRALSTYTLRRWARNPDDKVATLVGDGEAPPAKTEELLSCAPCHSTGVDWGPGSGGEFISAFDERFALALIDQEHFFADGQAKRDTSTYNSFIQTKKQHAGVVCSDCHDPHAGTLRSPAPQLCISCHSPDVYDSKNHTRHDNRHDVSCVDCHMPKKPFLGPDVEHDHSFPVPRPDLTISLGIPNACEACHANRPKWLATTFEEKVGRSLPARTTLAFYAAEQGAKDAPEKLNEILSDKAEPKIIRASSLKRWAELGRLTPELEEAIGRAARDESALVRRTAAEVSPFLPADARLSTLAPLLKDGARPVRIAASLASLSLPQSEKMSDSWSKALEEAKAAQSYQSDKIDGLLALAAIEERLRGDAAAKRYYELALERHKDDPRAFSARAASLARQTKIEEEQELVLRGLKLHPKDATLLLARGRYLVKQGKEREALPHLQGAFETSSRTIRKEAGYVYAVTVHHLGDWAEALAILRLLKNEHPEDQEVQNALDALVKERSKK